MVRKPKWISCLVLITVALVVLATGAYAQVDSSTPPLWFQPSEGAPIVPGPEGQLGAAAGGALAMYAPTVDVLLVQDVYPWSYNSNEIALSEAGVSYAVTSSAQLSSTDLSGIRCLMYSSDQPTSYYWNIDSNISRIESFVSNGGTLIAHACDYGWQYGLWEGLDILPGGVGHVVQISQYIHIVDASHPVVEGLSDDYFYNWNWSTHGYFTGMPDGANVIMESAPGEPTYVEYPWGSGRVLATLQTIEWGYGDGVNYNNVFRPDFLRNEIAYAVTLVPFEPILFRPPYDGIGWIATDKFGNARANAWGDARRGSVYVQTWGCLVGSVHPCRAAVYVDWVPTFTGMLTVRGDVRIFGGDSLIVLPPPPSWATIVSSVVVREEHEVYGASMVFREATKVSLPIPGNPTNIKGYRGDQYFVSKQIPVTQGVPIRIYVGVASSGGTGGSGIFSANYRGDIAGILLSRD